VKFLTSRQPHASLIATGVQTIVTRYAPTGYRGPLAIHAGAKVEHHGKFYMLARKARTAGAVNAEQESMIRYKDVPFGAVVAVCDLMDVVPIVAGHECSGYRAHLCESSGSWLLHSSLDAPWPDGETEHDVTDQLPYGDFTVDRFAWILDNVRPIEPVPMKGTQGLRDLPADIAEQIEVLS